MSRARRADDFDDIEEGFLDDKGDPILIDVEIDNETVMQYRQELDKMTNGEDPFGSMSYKALDGNTKRRVARQLKKKFEGQGGAKAKHINIEEINGYALYGLALPPYNLDHLIDLSVENDTHFACISLKALNIVGLGYEWEETSKVKMARQSVEDDDAKMAKLSRKLQNVKDRLDEYLDELNDEDDFIETLLKMWMDVEATGNGYLEFGRNRNGKIGYVGHVPAATVRVRTARDGFIQIVQDKLTFFRNFGDQDTADYFKKDANPNEMMHFKKHSPKNSYYGVPNIIAAMSSVAGDKFAAEYNLDYFENKAVPRYALIVKGAKLSAQAERRILEYFRREVKGKHHGTLYIPVPQTMNNTVDVELKAIENKVQEASFEKYRQGNQTSVAMVHHVPKSKLGLAVGVAAAREEDKSFKTQVTQPEQRRVAKRINRFMREMTDIYRIKFKEYDLVDAETKSRIHDRYIRLGVENPNEIRGELGHAPRKGGDKFVDMAEESRASIELQEAQGKAALMRGEATPGTTGASKGPDRKTTDGSPKNKQQTKTPAAQTSAGAGTRGSAQDKGEVPKSTRR